MARPDPIFGDEWYADLTREVPDDFRRYRRAEISLKGLVDSAEDVARYEMNVVGHLSLSERLAELLKAGSETDIRAAADLLAIAAIHLHQYRRGDDPLEEF